MKMRGSRTHVSRGPKDEQSDRPPSDYEETTRHPAASPPETIRSEDETETRRWMKGDGEHVEAIEGTETMRRTSAPPTRPVAFAPTRTLVMTSGDTNADAFRSPQPPREQPLPRIAPREE